MSAVTEILKRAKELNSNTRKNDAQKLMDYYRGQFNAGPTGQVSGSGKTYAGKSRYSTAGMGHTDALLSGIFKKKWEDISPHKAYVKLTSQIINKISMVWKEGVTLAFTDDEDGKMAAELDSIMPDNFEEFMQTVEVYTKLLSTVVVRVNYRGGRVELDLVTPNVLDVVQDEEDPTQAVAYIVTQTWTDTVSDTRIHYRIWTPDDTWIENEKGAPVGMVEPNPYNGELPFIPCYNVAPLDTFFNPLDYYLINAQEKANLLNTYMFYILAYADPVWFAKNCNLENLVIGPSKIIAASTMPGVEATLEAVNPQANPETYRRLLDGHIRDSLRAYGIEPPRDTGSTSSGIALKLENYERVENRRWDVLRWRSTVRDLISKIVTVYAAHNGGVLPVDIDRLIVDFGEVNLPIEYKDQLDNWEREIEMGLKSPAEVMMESNPDIDEETAKVQVQDNLTATKAMRTGYSLTDILGGTNE